MDEPVADLSMLGFAALSQLAAGHVTVALSGQGADEQLGGYTKHRAAAMIEALQRVPAPARRLAGRVSATLARPTEPCRRSARRMRSRRSPARDERPARSLRSAEPSPSAPLQRRRWNGGETDDPRAPRIRPRPAARDRPCTWTANSRSSTTCSTTSIAPRWRTRWRSACRSSIIASSSSAPRSRQG